MLLLLLVASAVSSEEESSCTADNEDPSPPPPKSCRLLLTQRPLPSTNNNNNNNGRILNDEYNYRAYGIYCATNIPKNYPLTPLGGDLVIHLVDVRTSPTTTASTTDNAAAATNDNIEGASSSSNNQLLKWYQYGYLQDASSSGYGGNYEGLGTVYSVLPGVGMLASPPPSSSSTTASATTTSNSDNDNNGSGESNNNDNPINLQPNIWASIPENDNGNHIRYQSSLAGSFTSYYNLTFQVTSSIGLDGGSEIWMDRFGWYRSLASKKKEKELLTAQNNDEEEKYKIDIDQLFQHGSCLDNIYPTPHSSKYGYGRGALSS